jgi:AbrB family looped-hinge helix DNA binding protein
MSKTTISSRGQVVIPREIRLLHGIRRGTKVEWVSHDAQTILVRKVSSKQPRTDWNAWAHATQGLGKEIWAGIDPVAYTREQRRERPQPR